MKRLLTACLCAFLSLTAAFAQTDVTVTVKDDMGPIIGANIMVKGTTNGQMTDLDGVAKFTSLKDTDVLVISFVGYKTAEVPVSGRSRVDIILEDDVETLDEVVVVGYGTMRRKDVTSSITTLKQDDLNLGVVTSPGELLQGKVPGLVVTTTGDPNGEPSVTLRGASTLRTGEAMQPII